MACYYLIKIDSCLTYSKSRNGYFQITVCVCACVRLCINAYGKNSDAKYNFCTCITMSDSEWKKYDWW